MIKFNKKQLKEIRVFSKKVEVLYQFCNWNWGDDIPTAKKIEELIIQLAGDLGKKSESISSGGIKIERDGERYIISFIAAYNLYLYN